MLSPSPHSSIMIFSIDSSMAGSLPGMSSRMVFPTVSGVEVSSSSLMSWWSLVVRACDKAVAMEWKAVVGDGYWRMGEGKDMSAWLWKLMGMGS
jgi:hypothetical protein